MHEHRVNTQARNHFGEYPCIKSYPRQDTHWNRKEVVSQSVTSGWDNSSRRENQVILP